MQQTQNRIYHEDFSYHTVNPYHQKMVETSLNQFVLADQHAEDQKGKWKEKIFESKAPIHLEIGCGFGNFMERFCQRFQDINFIGLDYRFKRMFKLAKRIESQSKTDQRPNFRLIRGRGERVHYLFSDSEIQRGYLFFPDPWPKARHQKNRIIQTEFLDALSIVLEENGEFWFKTDHPDLYQWAKECLQKHPSFSIVYDNPSIYTDSSSPLGDELYKTTFEKIFLRQNLAIHGIIAQNNKMKQKVNCL